MVYSSVLRVHPEFLTCDHTLLAPDRLHTCTSYWDLSTAISFFFFFHKAISYLYCIAGHWPGLNLVAILQLISNCPILTLDHLHFAELNRDWPERVYFYAAGQLNMYCNLCELQTPVFVQSLLESVYGSDKRVHSKFLVVSCAINLTINPKLVQYSVNKYSNNLLLFKLTKTIYANINKQL